MERPHLLCILVQQEFEGITPGQHLQSCDDSPPTQQPGHFSQHPVSSQSGAGVCQEDDQ